MGMVSAEQVWVGHQQRVMELVLQGNIHGNISSVAFSEDDTLAKKSNAYYDNIRCPRRQAGMICFREMMLEHAVGRILRNHVFQICTSV